MFHRVILDAKRINDVHAHKFIHTVLKIKIKIKQRNDDHRITLNMLISATVRF